MSNISDPANAQSWLARYSQTANGYDELLDATGSPRPHWSEFLQLMQGLGEREVARRWNATHRLLYENGIAHAAGIADREQPRPWDLDPLPLLLDVAEWNQLSEALAQRARLLNLLIGDLYDSQTVIKNGLLPAQVLYTHPGFLRAMHGHKPAENCHLHFYSADLLRDSQGNWNVVADRTEAPSGLGFALENRIAISRFLPGVMHHCQIQRLAPFFVTLKETLARLAPSRADNPHVVYLTEGPDNNSNYFEDSYLARYLGYTLVEGCDLTVRNEKVWLKTLSGLTPVDVIVRRPNSEDCDPLELSGNTRFGATGLAQAVRAGNVLVANSLGSGLAESPVFLAYLPQLCQSLLGEELKLSSPPTYWCGDPEQQRTVLANMESMYFAPTFRTRGRQRRRSDGLNNTPIAELTDRIRAAGSSYVAQKKIVRSTAPIWNRGEPRPGDIALRVYVVYADGDYQVLPGGLTRVSDATDPLEVTAVSGERSKDTWIVNDGPVAQVTLQDAKPQPAIRRRAADFPSRAAENFYWLGRHVARVESGARLLRSICVRLCDEADSETFTELPALLRALAAQGRIEPGFAVEGLRDRLPTIERALPDAVFDRNSTYSLRSVIDNLYSTASTVRDRLSADKWRIVHKLTEEFRRPTDKASVTASDLLVFLDRLLIDISAFTGLILDSMTRTPAWQFIEIGRRLELTLQFSILIQNTIALPKAPSSSLLEAVLETADSLMTYRSRYMANLQLTGVLDLLLTDESNPRSVAFQLNAIVGHVMKLPRDDAEAIRKLHEKSAMSMLHRLRMVDINQLARRNNQSARLRRVLSYIEDEIPKLSDYLCGHYFVQVGPTRTLNLRPTL